jgi:trk system potassium uptake protein TrkH
MIRWKVVLYILGILNVALACSLLFPLGVSLIVNEPDAAAFGLSTAAAALLGGVMWLVARRPPLDILHREALLIVALGWVNAALIGALPYWFGGTTGSLVDAVFESASGFTTTGATIMEDIEALPHGTLLWRSMTQWFGGMGIIVLSLAILPLLGVGGMQLFKAEVPGPTPDKLKPRVSETAKSLWKVYLLLTGVEAVLLMGWGMKPFDAICHAFTTMATGGFSTKSRSIESFGSPPMEWTVIFFMVAAGVNFSLHYKALTGRPISYWIDREFRTFLTMFVVITMAVAAILYLDGHGGVGDALRYSAFQVGSILTTTGYTTTDYEMWPYVCQAVLFMLMFVGGCAGSTGGGMKVMRIMILAKSAYRELFRIIHPHAVVSVKMGSKRISQEVIESIWGFFVLFLAIFVGASVAMMLLGMDMISGFSAVASSLGNVGPALGSVGPMDNYAHLPAAGKLILSGCMIVGRLEVYTLVVLLVPEFWRK